MYEFQATHIYYKEMCHQTFIPCRPGPFSEYNASFLESQSGIFETQLYIYSIATEWHQQPCPNPHCQPTEE